MATRWFVGLGAATACLLAGAGCVTAVTVHEHRVHRPRPVRVTHVCTHDCCHYHDGDRFVIVKGHRHGPGCGHCLRNGVWVVDTHPRKARRHDHPDHHRKIGPGPRKAHSHKHVVRKSHVHGHRCGCAYDRRAKVWVGVGTSHVHGPGCGHVFVNGRWCTP